MSGRVNQCIVGARVNLKRRTVSFAARAAAAMLAVLFSLAIAAGPASAASANRFVSYRGLRIAVPAGWPVFDLTRSPATCVRFDRHAVYLGRPGSAQRCPAHAAGHTEAILVEPLARASAARTLPLPAAGDPGAGPSASTEIIDRAHQVEVLATFHTRPDLIRRTLRLRRLPAPAPGLSIHRASAFGAARAAAAPRATSALAGAGQAFTGLGFDACSAPSAARMAAWSASPYRAVGVYLGGVNRGCSQPNLTSSWVSQQAANGWHLIPIYVGLQAPRTSCSCSTMNASQAASQGTAAAQDAVVQATALGLGPGNPIYDDMEAYTRDKADTTAVLAFLGAWTAELHAAGYLSGVYSSDASGIADLVSQYGTGYSEPDDLWIANWNNVQSTTDSQVPSTDWANHQRLHQYNGAHNETYANVTLNIDGDYLDGATAAAGSGAPPAPTLKVAPAADGSIALRPSWGAGPAVTDWQVLAGPTPSALTPAANPINATTGAIVVHSAYSYFAVNAIGPTGQVLGTSPAVATPSHLAIFGKDLFVPAQGLGAVPVGCYRSTPCHISARIVSGSTTLALTGREYVPPGGGLLYFSLSGAARQALSRAHGRLAVTVRIRDTSGLSARGVLALTAFSTTGRLATKSISSSPSLQIVGATDFVSHGWVGGILAACRASSPCHVSSVVSIGPTILARTGQEFLGVGELGYLVFTLTAQGHALLAHASGNQLLVRVSANAGGPTAAARVALVPYP